MSTRRTVFAAAIALAVVACTDTPTATDAVDEVAFAKPDESGVVVRDIVTSFLVIFDTDNDLRATVGFDREKWCGDGNGPVDPDLPGPLGAQIGADYRTEHPRQRIFHENGEQSQIIQWNGILSVYEEEDDDRLLLLTVTDCTDGVLLGLGTAHTRFTFTGKQGASDVTSDNMNGFITVDGDRKRVNAIFTHWDGVRNPDDGFQHIFNSKITVR
jgi:hypothetical protein